MRCVWIKSCGLFVAGGLILHHESPAAPAVTVQSRPGETVVSGPRYRLRLVPESMQVGLELLGAGGQWHPVCKPAGVSFELLRQGQSHSASGLRSTWAMRSTPEAILIGQQAVLDRPSGALLELHYLCHEQGVLVGARLPGTEAKAVGATLWSPPRLALAPAAWDGYRFWGPDGTAHAGRLVDLQGLPAYAGVSPWEQTGDTVGRLSAGRPALVAHSSAWDVGLGVVFLDYTNRWAGAHSFLQRHTRDSLYLYAGYVPASRARQELWAWLAPFADQASETAGARVDELIGLGEILVRDLKPIAPPVPREWLQPAADFPRELRRAEPVRNINEAVVFSINESTTSDSSVALARRCGSDMLIRGWFKWGQAPPVDRWRPVVSQAHELGALFGGGITCSALYDRENGLSQEQTLDMATRGPDGQLVNAWDLPGIRHGSLSSPAYLDHLFRWCREQIDAGADYLFMDEHTAALGPREGYDDHSLADFRRYLLEAAPQTQGWKPDDPRWATQFHVDPANREICPGGDMRSFSYRAFLGAKKLLGKPGVPANPLDGLWHQFRTWRDDRAWKSLTDRIRAHARQQGRRVLISANGLARYVDLQVLGVWDQWLVKDGQIDLGANQLPYWRGLVTQGHELAGGRVPVVLFHDWGVGDPPFPWLAVPPSQREVWMRTRGAEIYAAGAFFAFPVLGPFGCDAGRDATLPTMASQARFYQAHRDLYLRGRYLGSECVRTDDDALSLAAWAVDEPRAVALHVINRQVKDGALQPRRNVTLGVPLKRLPNKARAISPDWAGDRPVACLLQGDKLRVTLGELEAYTVVRLSYDQAVDLSQLKDPARARLTGRWDRPMRSEFRVRPEGSIENASELNGYLQGRLHTHLRNPPTFLVNAARPATLSLQVRAVAQAGARLEYRVDGRIERTVELPDLDGKNDGAAAEYDRTFTFAVPPGAHRITLDNVGPDWLVIPWIQFEGEFKE